MECLCCSGGLGRVIQGLISPLQTNLACVQRDSALPDTGNRAFVLSGVPAEERGGVGWEQEKPSAPFPFCPRLWAPLLRQEVPDCWWAELGRGRVAMAGQPARQGPGPHLWGLAGVSDLAGVSSTLLPASARHQVLPSHPRASRNFTQSLNELS